MRFRLRKSGPKQRFLFIPDRGAAAVMRNIKLVLEYDGAAFFGFQRQPRHLSVQEALEAALCRLFNRSLKIAAASGRTDTGVHAAGQVVNFKVDSPMTVQAIQKALNGILPKTIAVLKAEEAEGDFHARYSAVAKTYEYRIWNSPVRSPLLAGKVCHVSLPLDVGAMKKAAAVLTGRHDFRSFCGHDPSRKEERDTVRSLYTCSLRRNGKDLRIRVTADGFLYRMVRNIAGALVEAGLGKLTPSQLKLILDARDRRKAPKTMPPEGLTLINVKYAAKSKKKKKA